MNRTKICTQFRFLLSFCLIAPAAATADPSTDRGEWPSYGADQASSKYTPLDQINEDNVNQLAIAWRWDSVDHLVEKKNPDLGLRQTWFETTPLMIAGELYVRTSYSQLAALDAATGVTLWTYDPESYLSGRPAMFGFISRGLSYWTDGSEERLVYATGDLRLISVDRKTGLADTKFGDNGQVDLHLGLRVPVDHRQYTVSSPPVICRGVIVVGSAISDGARQKEMPPGDVRGYDVRTGEHLWTFHTIPQEGEFGVETWKDDAWKYSGNTNVWSMMSADEELGYVYLPVSTPTNDWYGGHRLGDNLFAESLVCLNARTGKRVWHFQMVHHGLWDYDLPCAPNLADITVDGKTIKAVAQVSKQGFTYVFDRVTGEPVWPIEERPVPQTRIPGEATSATQPFPTKPPAFARQGITRDDVIDFTPELHAKALATLESFTYGPVFTPPTLRGTIESPGWAGGADWGGAAVDRETGILYVPSINRPILSKLAEADSSRTNFRYMRTTPRDVPGIEGLPLFKPPYSTVTAVDLNRGENLWTVPIGDGPIDHPLLNDLNLPPLGAGGRGYPLVTKTLLFIGSDWTSSPVGEQERKIRALDKVTGRVIAEIELPATPNANPMSYMAGGKQFVLVACGGQEENSMLLALSLP